VRSVLISSHNASQRRKLFCMSIQTRGNRESYRIAVLKILRNHESSSIQVTSRLMCFFAICILSHLHAWILLNYLFTKVFFYFSIFQTLNLNFTIPIFYLEFVIN